MNDYTVSNVIKEINNNQEIAQIDISNVVIYKILIQSFCFRISPILAKARQKNIRIQIHK